LDADRGQSWTPIHRIGGQSHLLIYLGFFVGFGGGVGFEPGVSVAVGVAVRDGV